VHILFGRVCHIAKVLDVEHRAYDIINFELCAVVLVSQSQRKIAILLDLLSGVSLVTVSIGYKSGLLSCCV